MSHARAKLVISRPL